MKKIYGRAWRGALLKRRAFQEVYWDNEATADGVIVVASVQFVLFAAALGFEAVGLVGDGRIGIESLLPALLRAMVYGVAGWLILAGATWLAATKILKQHGNVQTMMAMHGLAYLPLLATLIPSILTGAAAIATGVAAVIWYLVVVVVATREAIESDMKNAALSVLIGYAVLAILASIVRGGVFSAVPFL